MSSLTDVCSYDLAPPSQKVFFASMADDALRDFCRGASPDNGRTNWSAWTRDMLLAFCRNRWPCGYCVIAERQP